MQGVQLKPASGGALEDNVKNPKYTSVLDIVFR